MRILVHSSVLLINMQQKKKLSKDSEATDFKFGQYIHRVHPNKSPLKCWRKWSVDISRDCPNFVFGGGGGLPLLSQDG